MMDTERDRKVLESTKHYLLEGKPLPPVLILKNGTVLDGAHRIVACRELGISVPVVYLDAEIVMVDPNNLLTWIDLSSDKES